MNSNCDGDKCRSATGEVRLYPLGGGANLILCADCWRHENAYRRERGRELGRPEDWPQVGWAEAERYPVEGVSGFVEITEARYDDMLGAVPPLCHTADGFLLGEAVTQKRCIATGEWSTAYRAYMHRGGRHYESERPMTVAEYRAWR